MRAIGYTIDVAIIAAVGYVVSQHPAVARVQEVGLWKSIETLPTPILATNATGFFIPEGCLPTDGELKVQQWFNYILGEDLGSTSHQFEEVVAFQEANKWKNQLVLPSFMIKNLPHVLSIWMRNMVAGWALYFVCGGLWALWMYGLCRKRHFPKEEDVPAWEDIKLQMGVSASAMVFYSLAPTLGEWFIERGWTQTYHSLDHVAGSFGGLGALGGGLFGYAAWLVIYMLFVEWGIFWVHYILHFGPLYQWLHKPHHIYNNRNSLSPFAGLAFDPVDGLLQASPYMVGLFLMPVHFWTYEALLFFTAVWTTNIHDTLTGDTEPIMGSAYHTIHHTTYNSNYGQIFVLYDWLHDTLAPPLHRREQWGWNTPTGRDYSAAYRKLGAAEGAASDVPAKGGKAE